MVESGPAIDDAYTAVVDAMAAAKRLGYEALSDGTQLFGRAPHLGPHAWLHQLYRPLTSAEIDALHASLSRPLPPQYAAWLARANGANLFSDALAIFGLRSDYSRQIGVHEPYNVRTIDLYERPPDSHPAFFFFGGYSAGDGSWLYVDAHDGAVHRCTRRSSSPLNSWPDLATMLVNEVKRLSTLFDATGRQRDPATPTTPPSDH